MKTLILAIGNKLLTDDGIGIHILQELHHKFTIADEVTLIDGGTLSFPLLALIENVSELILIDAAQLNAAPGTIQVFMGDDMDHFVNLPNKNSVHEISITEIVNLAKLSGSLPVRRALIAIQPQIIAYGDTLSNQLISVIPIACDIIRKLVTSWRNNS